MHHLQIKVFCISILLLNTVKGYCQSKEFDSLHIDKVDTIVVREQLLRLKVGDKFPEMHFYNLNGEKFGLDSVFKTRPVIFITGSYSCPIFRYNSKNIYRTMKRKSKKYDIYFIYLAEAHPLVGSPYGRRRDSSAQNKLDKIFLEQQEFIIQRIEIAKKIKTDFNIFSRVILDNEKNDFYNKVIASPNTYCIFSKEGILTKQRVWYDRKGLVKAKKRRVNPPAMIMHK